MGVSVGGALFLCLLSDDGYNYSHKLGSSSDAEDFSYQRWQQAESLTVGEIMSNASV